jgi:predicted MFS family arabinose efflux permease
MDRLRARARGDVRWHRGHVPAGRHGIAQSATWTAIFDQVPATGYGTASALWNLAYDSGFGVGAIGSGVLAAQLEYPGAFAITALVVVAALPLGWSSDRLGEPPTARRG